MKITRHCRCSDCAQGARDHADEGYRISQETRHRTADYALRVLSHSKMKNMPKDVRTAVST